MCDDCKNAAKQEQYRDQAGSELTARLDSHTIYELKQQRDYHLRKVTDIQNAIDAVIRVGC